MQTPYTGNITANQPKRESKFYVRSNGVKASERITGAEQPRSSTPVPGSMRIDGNEAVYGFLPSKRPPVIPHEKSPINVDEYEQYLYDIAIISEVPFVH